MRGEIARFTPPHNRFRAAMPSWDNTARKGPAGNVFAGATPAMFETWMRYLVADARQRLPEGQRFIFVNAWNEWAEGTHLEPDRKYGHANLRAVRNALAPDARALAPLLPPADGSEDRLAETRQHVERLIIANRELTRLIRRDKYDLRLGEEQSLVFCTPKMLTVSALKEGRLNIELANGRGLGSGSRLILQQGGPLNLHGWFFMPNHNMDVAFLSLQHDRNESGGRYIVQIYRRTHREDVLQALGLEGTSTQNGFSIAVSLRGVPAGEYKIEILAADPKDAKKAVSLETSLRVVIG